MESLSAIIDPISDLYQYLDCKSIEDCKVVVTLRKYSIIAETHAHQDTKAFSLQRNIRLCLIYFDFILFYLLPYFGRPSPVYLS